MPATPTGIDAIPPWRADPAAYFNYEFGYDGLGRRVWTQSNQGNGNGSWFIYDGDQLVQERDFRSDNLVVEYAWGPTTGAPAIFYQNRIVADVPQERWIYTSPQGGFPRHLFDDTGAITDTFQYSSFGELVFHDGSTEVDFGWRGDFLLSALELSLIHLDRKSVYVPNFAVKVVGGNDQTYSASTLQSANLDVVYCSELAKDIMSGQCFCDEDTPDFGTFVCCQLLAGSVGLTNEDCLPGGLTCDGVTPRNPVDPSSCLGKAYELTCKCSGGGAALYAALVAIVCPLLPMKKNLPARCKIAAAARVKALCEAIESGSPCEDLLGFLSGLTKGKRTTGNTFQQPGE